MYYIGDQPVITQPQSDRRYQTTVVNYVESDEQILPATVCRKGPAFQDSLRYFENRDQLASSGGVSSTGSQSFSYPDSEPGAIYAQNVNTSQRWGQNVTRIGNGYGCIPRTQSWQVLKDHYQPRLLNQDARVSSYPQLLQLSVLNRSGNPSYISTPPGDTLRLQTPTEQFRLSTPTPSHSPQIFNVVTPPSVQLVDDSDLASSRDVNLSMFKEMEPISEVVTTPPAPTPTAAADLRMMTPPGFHILKYITRMSIRQNMPMDIAGGCGAPNSYQMLDGEDEEIYVATEESSCLCRWVCGPNRQFSISVFDRNTELVLDMHRSSCRCDWCCCIDCALCLQKLYIVDSLGRTVGVVKQKFGMFKAKFDIEDHDNNVLFKVRGPCCPCRCSTELLFDIFDKTGEVQIGRIQKKWGGDRDDFVNVDHEFFQVTFPQQLECIDKGLLIGAAFLVNFMYLEMS